MSQIKVIPIHQQQQQPQSIPADIFIVVRPPPSASNPDNLQIQLLNLTGSTNTNLSGGLGANATVSGGGRARSSSVNSRLSVDSNRDTLISNNNNLSTGGLVKSPSLKSVRSNRSSSLNSTGSSGVSNRKVTPLYNLGFHPVLPTTITDAGTDSKVAKFLKRSLEIINFATIDPIELNQPLKPSISIQSSSNINTDSTPSKEFSTTSSSGSFLSKFKKMNFKTPPILASLSNKSESNPSLFSTKGVPLVPLSRSESTTLNDNNNNTSSPRNSMSNDEVASGAPSVSASSLRSRVVRGKRGYTWVIRKWHRKDIISNVDNGLQASNNVRFEWIRGKKPRPSPHNQLVSSTQPPLNIDSTNSNSNTSNLPIPLPIRTRSRTNTLTTSRPNSILLDPIAAKLATLQLPTGESESTDPNNLVKSRGRPKSLLSVTGGGGGKNTPDSDRSRSPARSTSYDSGSEDDNDGEGNESDTEDSDRSWTCFLIYSLPSSSTSSNNNTNSTGLLSERRIQLGTFIPAPHHPQLIGRLAVPINLNSIPLIGIEEGLSVEEMKDVLCTTLFWLIVRENIGGVGKKKKSDGVSWKLGK